MKTLTVKKTRILAAAAATALGALALLSAQGGGFQFHGPLSRVLTPNNDGKNDLMIICFDNPSDSEVSARVFTMRGSHVADMSAKTSRATPPPGGAGAVSCPAGALPNSPQYVFWDGRSSGSFVKSGAYVYQLQSEGLTFTGTLLVVR